MQRARLFRIFGALLGGVLGLVSLTPARDAAAQGAQSDAAPSAAVQSETGQSAALHTETAKSEGSLSEGPLSEVTLPGGLEAALAVINDRSAPDRGHFLLEVIRRTHQSPAGPQGFRADVLPPLLAHLDRLTAPGTTAGAQASATSAPPLPAQPGPAHTAPASKSPTSAAPAGSPATLPLPLPMSVWIDTVFGGRATPETLTAEILRSRNASLLYSSLMALDDPTRAWLASRPDLITDLVTRHAAAFTLAAPGLRATSAGVLVPGGELAVPAWEAIVGRPVKDPAAFVRALLAQEEAHLPYFYGAMAQLSPGQVRRALHLDARDANARLEAARRLHAVFGRVAAKWSVDTRAFWRPSLDPALLIADLRRDDEGRPVVPGTRAFWAAVFSDPDRAPDDARALVDGEPVELAWLCEQVFDADTATQRRRYRQVLFASRILSRVAPEQAREAAQAVHAAGRFPALAAALERVRLVDVAVIAGAARRAAELSEMDDETRAVRALGQFQGVLMILTRAAARGSLSTTQLAEHVVSLSAIELGKEAAYDGRLVRWLESRLAAGTPSSPAAASADDLNAAALEHDLLALLAGPAVPSAGASSARAVRADESAGALAPRMVDWEGTRYRVDLTTPELMRLTRVRGEHPRPYVSAARALVNLADALADPKLSRDRLRQESETFTQVATAVGWLNSEDEVGGTWGHTDAPGRARDVTDALKRSQKGMESDGGARLASQLRMLADDLLARGLMEMAYAAALGQPERTGLLADDAASRHDFGLRVNNVRHRYGAWQFPATSADTRREWRTTGSLLGLDVKLAQFSLVRLSTKAIPRRPTLDEEDRRVIAYAVALVESTRLTDADRDAIVTALRKGRTRLTTVQTPREAEALADEIGLSSTRRTLLAWTVARDRNRLAAFLSPSELFWLGLERTPLDARLHAWGAPAEPRLGCMCLQMFDRRPWESLTGRWGTGVLITAFPDLNLRLAELLAELRMPAMLLGPVLTSATLDFNINAQSRDPDDRRGMVEFVHALTPERMEHYLALLTTDGPLVPHGKAAESTARTGVSP